MGLYLRAKTNRPNQIAYDLDVGYNLPMSNDAIEGEQTAVETIVPHEENVGQLPLQEREIEPDETGLRDRSKRMTLQLFGRLSVGAAAAAATATAATIAPRTAQAATQTAELEAADSTPNETAEAETIKAPEIHETSEAFRAEYIKFNELPPEEFAELAVKLWLDELETVHKITRNPSAFTQYIAHGISEKIKSLYGVVGGSGRFKADGVASANVMHQWIVAHAALVEGTFQKALDFVDTDMGYIPDWIFDEEGNVSTKGMKAMVAKMMEHNESDFRIFFLAWTAGYVSIEDLPRNQQRIFTTAIVRIENSIDFDGDKHVVNNPPRNRDYHKIFDLDRINAVLGNISSGSSFEDGSGHMLRHGMTADQRGSWKQIVQDKVNSLPNN